MRSFAKGVARKILAKFGYQLEAYPDKDFIRRMKIVDKYKIDVLLDVGANDGNYAIVMREMGFQGRIISFEPITAVFKVLQQVSQIDQKWDVYNFALGETNRTDYINVAGNSVSSSLLDMHMLPDHLDSSEPSSKYVGREKIQVKTLDSVLHQYCEAKNRIMLKIDVQGFEMQVLQGAKDSLKQIKILQLEMSLVELYKGETTYLQMLNYLFSIGFELASIENGFSDNNSGELLQFDGVFINRHIKYP